jgi:hypothetical protein
MEPHNSMEELDYEEDYGIGDDAGAPPPLSLAHKPRPGRWHHHDHP